jgi:hypothetical protein
MAYYEVECRCDSGGDPIMIMNHIHLCSVREGFHIDMTSDVHLVASQEGEILNSKDEISMDIGLHKSKASL